MTSSMNVIEPIMDGESKLIASLSSDGIMITIEPINSPETALDFSLLSPKDAYSLGSALVEWSKFEPSEVS